MSLENQTLTPSHKQFPPCKRNVVVTSKTTTTKREEKKNKPGGRVSRNHKVTWWGGGGVVEKLNSARVWITKDGKDQLLPITKKSLGIG